MKMIDLTGQKFGRLTVLGYVGRNKSRASIWSCKCDCENVKEIISSHLKNGNTKSCGCLQKEKLIQRSRNRFIDLTGQRFGKLLVLSRANNSKNGKIRWNCICDCGKETIVIGGGLKNGSTKSCGCFQIERCKTRRNCWTKEEIDILKQFYVERGSKYCSKLLNRTKKSIKRMAFLLNLKRSIKIEWTKEKDDILKQFYPEQGTVYCSNLLHIKKHCVTSRVKKLNLRVTYASCSGLPKKFVIQKLSKTQVVSVCEIHGETEHYYRNEKILRCIKCRRLTYKKYSELPINNFACRLRGSIKGAFKRMRDKNGGSREIGAMRYLDYTSRELYNYLENIRKLQNNKCPCCKISYNKCKISIDHVIPVVRAKTEQEIIDLFDLKNLNLICKSCNSSKQDKDYNTWKDSKDVVKF